MTRQIECTDYLSARKVEKLISQFGLLAKEPQPIRLLFNSLGGDTHATLEFARFLEHASVPTIGIAHKASSGAALAFISCSKRCLYKTGYIGIHMPKIRISIVDIPEDGMLSPQNVETINIWRMETIRILRKQFRGPEKVFQKIVKTRDTTRFGPEDALESGFADEIIEL